MGTEAGAKGFISMSKMFTWSIYRKEKQRVKGKGGASGHKGGNPRLILFGSCPEKETCYKNLMLQHFFSPSSVAVVGASQNPAKIGYEILNNIVRYGYGGAVYPINPKAQEIMGHSAYPALSAVPDRVDLAVVAVPPNAVMGVLEECGEKGAPKGHTWKRLSWSGPGRWVYGSSVQTAWASLIRRVL